MFIIDFDDTLFDTQAFKQARLEAVSKLGVSEEEYWATYRQARNSPDGLFTYSNERHAAVLAELGYRSEEALEVLQSTTGEMLAEFIFPDTFSFLDSLKSYGQPMILLSLGNPGFQELKTKGSGIHTYFDRLFMIHTTKEHVLGEVFELVHDTPVWFINDKISETKRILESFPGKMKAVLKMSGQFDRLEYKKSGLPYFGTLKEIEEYVREKIS